jgi:hypothetical protein
VKQEEHGEIDQALAAEEEHRPGWRPGRTLLCEKKHLALTGSNRSTVGAKQPEETGLCDGKIKKHSDWASVGRKTESSGGKENLP